MQPWITQAAAREHREDLLRAACRHRNLPEETATGDDPQRPSWDVRLGWFLIRLGWRLVAQRATPARLGVNR